LNKLITVLSLSRQGRAGFRAGFVGSGQHFKPSEEEERENEFVFSLSIIYHYHGDVKAVLIVLLGLPDLVNVSNPAKKGRETLKNIYHYHSRY
jgi:hypothetical protein